MKLLLLFLLTLVNLYAVITIAPVEVGKKPGYSGILQGSFETKRGNTELDNYAAGLRLQYDDNRSFVLWSDFTFAYGEVSGEKNTNKYYTHIRYIHTFYEQKKLIYELFVQIAANEFTKVAQRDLVGGGYRYQYNLSKYGDFYLGCGGFYERLRYTKDADPSEDNARLNTYLSYVKKFTNDSKLSYVMYYQPKIDEFDDYIFSNGVELQVVIYKQLLLTFHLYYDIDSVPAIGVKTTDFTQKTSFIYKF